MVRFSTSTAVYLAAATFLGAVALPTTAVVAATPMSASDRQVAQAGTSSTVPGAHTRSSRARSASLQKGEQPTQRVEQRIRQLHAELKITPQQEDKWNAFADVMRQNAQAMQSQIQQRAQNQRNMTAMDDLNAYEQISQAHADDVKKLVSPFQALYDSMSPQQKKNADMVFNRYGQRMASKNGMSPANGARTQMQ